MNPAAVVVEVGEGADSVEDLGAGKVAVVNILDNVAEGGLQIAVALSEKIEGVGVVVDCGFGQDAEAVHDRLGAAPMQEGFVDLFALGMAADGAFAGVAFDGGEAGRIVMQELLIVGGGCRRQARAGFAVPLRSGDAARFWGWRLRGFVVW